MRRASGEASSRPRRSREPRWIRNAYGCCPSRPLAKPSLLPTSLRAYVTSRRGERQASSVELGRSLKYSESLGRYLNSSYAKTMVQKGISVTHLSSVTTLSTYGRYLGHMSKSDVSVSMILCLESCATATITTLSVLSYRES